MSSLLNFIHDRSTAEKRRSPRWWLLLFAVLAGSSSACIFAEDLEPAPSPVDNPLKGLVPYANPAADRFPHSMEFSYLPLSDLMVGKNDFRWEPLEKLLDDIASRGNHAVFRIYLEYPGKTDGIPNFLEEQGLKVHEYQNTNTAPFPPTKVRTPNYSSPLLRESLTTFIAALGGRYDNDPRIGYIHAGLLGTWGEWHTYPRDDLWASKETQGEVLDAYAKAFQKTPVLLRYPAGPDHWDQAANADRPFGYHDDSFAWATLDTGKKDDSWFFVPALRSAGPKAVDKWKTHPVGGEIRPEVWGKIFDRKITIKQAQDFEQCVRETHVSWLMDSGMFEKKAPADRYERAIAQVRRMGYDFFVKSADLKQKDGQLEVQCEVINQGIAPFYRDWPLELALLDDSGRILHQQPVDWKLTGLLPGETRTWSAEIDAQIKPPAEETFVAVRAINPLPSGKPLRFANKNQDEHAAGWLTLGKVTK